MPDNKQEQSPFKSDDELYGKKIKAVPRPPINIDADVKQEFYDNIVAAAKASELDIAKIEAFNLATTNREQVYKLLDTMAEDSTISAVLETYAEDATETNEDGRIIWCQSDDESITKYITYLLDTMQIDKHIYQWVYNLCKYGDIYVRLFRQSDEDMTYIDSVKDKTESTTEILNELVNINVYKKSDKYTHYVELESNPAEIFELTKFGKTHGYIKVNTTTLETKQDFLMNNPYRYSFNAKDVDVYDAMAYVHAALEDNSSRTPEEVNIYITNDVDVALNLSYTVKRGQSLLYNSFKIWREMMLLQNALLLNRITKSSVVRIVGVEVGDMPKENVGPHLLNIKLLMELKTALNAENETTEYTNPGPMENNIYVPTHGGIGNISILTSGGDVDVKGLADIDYFTNKLFGSLRVPKQYFCETEDSTGFNGGTSLTIISSRYAKMIRRIQNTIIQMVTDMVNLMCIDKGFNSYINRFQIKMLPPTTQEDLDRRDNLSSKIGMVSDLMNLVDGIPLQSAKLKILKDLLSECVTNSDVLGIIDEQIEFLENSDDLDQNPDADMDSEFGGGTPMSGLGGGSSIDNFDMGDGGEMMDTENPESTSTEDTSATEGGTDESVGDESADTLPTPAELNAGDFTEM